MSIGTHFTIIFYYPFVDLNFSFSWLKKPQHFKFNGYLATKMFTVYLVKGMIAVDN